MELQLDETTSFLEALSNGEAVGTSGRDLVDSLLRALVDDGFINEAHRVLHELPKSSEDIEILDVVLVFVCIIFAGLASGLTQGLLSLDLMELEIKMRSGTVEEQGYAAKLIPIISNHHLLLVSLMLWNASATESLPIFLNRLVPEWMAVIISVTLVLFVGEIIPASILTGPRQLQYSAWMSPLVYLVLGVFFPIAYPISSCLDYIIGHDEGMTMYSRQEIATMMKIHQEESTRRKSSGISAIEEEEVFIIDGALKYREMCVEQVMTPQDKVFMIPVTENLSYKTIYAIFKSGYSRIPVYNKNRHDIVGLILAKDLIFVDPEDETPVQNFMLLFGRKPAVVWHDQKLGETLAMFKREKAHMAVVRDAPCFGSVKIDRKVRGEVGEGGRGKRVVKGDRGRG
ncbi:hypothetical protein B484DRAFT_324434 [Ochromonadaceae sp. CCMP2298]|nr:hypothetical protein B484DRAFT_324434 [Ochromonadaceae sp. CCMP2298]